jgi:hypothetical protein
MLRVTLFMSGKPLLQHIHKLSSSGWSAVRETATPVLRGMASLPWKTATMLLLTLGLVAAGTGRAQHAETAKQASVSQAPQTMSSAARKAVRQDEKARTDRYGDPLPEGAVARLGTTRFRDSNNAYSVCYSPDGKILAAIGDDGVRLWNAANGKELHSYYRQAVSKDTSFPRAGYDRGFFSPDGQRLWLQASSAWQNSPGKEIYFWK